MAEGVTQTYDIVLFRAMVVTVVAGGAFYYDVNFFERGRQHAASDCQAVITQAHRLDCSIHIIRLYCVSYPHVRATRPTVAGEQPALFICLSMVRGGLL